MGTPRPELPTGTVTFLRTDVEGSMRLARTLGSGWDVLNDRQLGIVRGVVRERDGVTVRTEGDAVFAVFRDAGAAVQAAIEIQWQLAAQPWPDGAVVLARVGLHSGEAHPAGDDYGGFDVNRAARIAAVGHGGQIILSDPTRALVASVLTDGVVIRDLGRHLLKDVPQPEHLFQLDAPGLRTDFPPISTRTATVGNIPTRLTSFIARERELEALGALLEDCRLITISGPGGIGKTSLAVELARSRAADFPDGAWMVRLEEASEPSQVVAAIARTLGIYDGAGRPVAEGLAHFLAERRALLVLDNFEHVLAAATEVAKLLRSAPDLHVVVTSRAALHVGGEQEYPVGSLDGERGNGAGRATGDSLPAARRLFIDRARSVSPGWDPGADAAVVDEICRLLDGLPLGIELAAARIGLLPPAVIRDRLAARLPLPGPGPRDVPDRHRTVEATVGWSYDLLDTDHQRLLAELSVFEGGFDLEQAVVVATLPAGRDMLDALIELADQSLIARSVRVAPDSPLGGIRFAVLETIRTFAHRRLGDGGLEADCRRRHAVAFRDLAEVAAHHVPGAEQARWLDRLAEDHANLRAAIRWSIDADETELAQRLSSALWRYWQLGGHLREGRELAEAVVAMPRAGEPSPSRLWALAAAGGLAYWQADQRRANDLYLEQLEVAGQIGDRAGEADARYNLAATMFIGGQHELATRNLEAAAALYGLIGDEIGLARTEWGWANLQMQGGDADVREALDRITAALERYRALGDAMYEALVTGSMAHAHLRLGDRREALRTGVQSVAAFHALRDVATATISLASGAIMMLEFDLNEEAATLMGAFDALCAVHGVQAPAGIGWLIAQSRPEERAYAALASETWEAAVRRGRAMSLDEAVRYAIEVADRILADPPGSDEGGPQSSSE